MKKPRLIASVAVASVAIVGIFLLPIPHYVRCGFYVQPRGTASVYVESGGELRHVHVRPGEWVDEGQPIATLENVDAKLSMVRLEGERKKLVSRLDSLRQRAFADDAAGLEITEVKESIASIDDQLVRQQHDLNALRITAPTSGMVIRPSTIPKPQDDPGRLSTWHGSTFDAKNHLAFLTEGTPFCQVGDPKNVEAILAVDQGDIEFVHAGQVVDIFVTQLRSQRLVCQLDQISQLDMKVTPRSLSAKSGGELVTRTDGSGYEKPMSTTYQANVPLGKRPSELTLGATGQAKIHAGYQTIATRLWRYVCQTFNFV